jgi:hypothetical protein
LTFAGEEITLSRMILTVVWSMADITREANRLVATATLARISLRGLHLCSPAHDSQKQRNPSISCAHARSSPI